MTDSFASSVPTAFTSVPMVLTFTDAAFTGSAGGLLGLACARATAGRANAKAAHARMKSDRGSFRIMRSEAIGFRVVAAVYVCTRLKDSE